MFVSSCVGTTPVDCKVDSSILAAKGGISVPAAGSIVQWLITPTALWEHDVYAVPDGGMRGNSKPRLGRFRDPGGLADFVAPIGRCAVLAAVNGHGLTRPEPDPCGKRQSGEYQLPHARILLSWVMRLCRVMAPLRRFAIGSSQRLRPPRHRLLRRSASPVSCDYRAREIIKSGDRESQGPGINLLALPLARHAPARKRHPVHPGGGLEVPDRPVKPDNESATEGILVPLNYYL